MVSSLLLLVVIAAGVTVAVRRGSRGTGGSGDARTVRRVFQYLLLYGLVVVTAAGVSGLLGRLLVTDLLVAGDDVGLARDLAFVVVGGPLLVGATLWTRRRFAGDGAEAGALSWAVYVTAASLTALVVAMTSLHRVLEWAVGLEDHDGPAVATTLVWGGVWVVHRAVDARVTPREHARVHHVAGSLIGLAVAATGLAAVLAGSLRVLLRLGDESLLARGDDPVLPGVVTLLVGAPVWVVYWLRTAAKSDRHPLWLVYVLLAGVGAGLLVAVVAASTLLYSVLVWLVGEPGTSSAAEHFDGAPGAAAGVAVGALVWWYHAAVVRAGAGGEGGGPRTEVHRVYEYLMAAIGLLAAAGGLLTVLAAFVEAATGATLVGGDAVNTLLAAATLVGVGGPVWWLYWRRVQAAAGRAPAEELASPTRRLYVLVLLGLGVVAGVVALVTTVFLLFVDVVAGTLGAETLRRMRFAVGVLLTAAAVGAYHAAVYRDDGARRPAAVEAPGPRYVLLVGSAGPEVAREVARRTGGHVQAWARTDDDPPWSVDEVMAALADTAAQDVVLLREAGALRAVGVRRG